jgi:hypothetical protein
MRRASNGQRKPKTLASRQQRRRNKPQNHSRRVQDAHKQAREVDDVEVEHGGAWFLGLGRGKVFLDV